MKKYVLWILFALLFCTVTYGGCGGGHDDSFSSTDSEESQPLTDETDTTETDTTSGRGGSNETFDNVIDLSALTASYTAQDGDTLTGTLVHACRINIANGATVTLRDVTITGETVNASKRKTPAVEILESGITCKGDAVIILEGDNTVKSFAAPHAGIEVIKNYTLRIKGNGSLKAYSNGYGSGIGGRGACGNIIIESGNITAEGDTGIGACGILPSGNITILGGTVNAKVIPGGHGAGIGSGQDGICGNILIRGGIVNVDASESGNEEGAGIGSGAFGTCGDITITKGVTKVTVTCRGISGMARAIGPGFDGKCGLVVIGGDEGYIYDNPYTYP